MICVCVSEVRLCESDADDIVIVGLSNRNGSNSLFYLDDVRTWLLNSLQYNISFSLSFSRSLSLGSYGIPFLFVFRSDCQRTTGKDNQIMYK